MIDIGVSWIENDEKLRSGVDAIETTDDTIFVLLIFTVDSKITEVKVKLNSELNWFWLVDIVSKETLGVNKMSDKFWVAKLENIEGVAFKLINKLLKSGVIDCVAEMVLFNISDASFTELIPKTDVGEISYIDLLSELVSTGSCDVKLILEKFKENSELFVSVCKLDCGWIKGVLDWLNENICVELSVLVLNRDCVSNTLMLSWGVVITKLVIMSGVFDWLTKAFDEISKLVVYNVCVSKALAFICGVVITKDVGNIVCPKLWLVDAGILEKLLVILDVTVPKSELTDNKRVSKSLIFNCGVVLRNEEPIDAMSCEKLNSTLWLLVLISERTVLVNEETAFDGVIPEFNVNERMLVETVNSILFPVLLKTFCVKLPLDIVLESTWEPFPGSMSDEVAYDETVVNFGMISIESVICALTVVELENASTLVAVSSTLWVIVGSIDGTKLLPICTVSVDSGVESDNTRLVLSISSVK